MKAVTVQSVDLLSLATHVKMTSAKNVLSDAFDAKRLPAEIAQWCGTVTNANSPSVKNAILLHTVRNATVGLALNAI